MLKVGERIRELRKLKKITLDELSEKSGVALATLSRMENGKMIGTLKSHSSICKVLGISLARLYEEVETEAKTPDLSHKTSRAEKLEHNEKIKQELLVADPSGKKITPVLIKLAPSSAIPERTEKFGTEKFIYVLAGEIKITAGPHSYTLSQGDSLYLEASLSHSFANTGKTEAQLLCATAYPGM